MQKHMGFDVLGLVNPKSLWFFTLFGNVGFFLFFDFHFLFFSILIFTFWPLWDQFWAIWSSETERGGEITMDRPVLSCQGAPGAELGPIWWKMGRKRASLEWEMEPEARVSRRMWPVRFDSLSL